MSNNFVLITLLLSYFSTAVITNVNGKMLKIINYEIL